MNEHEYVQEANVLAKYLTGRPASPQVAVLYADAIRKVSFHENARQQHLWQWCIRHSWSLKYLDAAFAWPQRYHSLRKRIYIMVAILETQSSYSDRFLPGHHSSGYIVVIILKLMRAFLYMVAGKILIWFI